MKRKHACYGTLSPENAAHPLVQMLTLPNYSTIRVHLYEALNWKRDAATQWSLKCLVPGVLAGPPMYRTFLYEAEHTVVSYETKLSPELQQEILSAYKSVYGRTHRLEYAVNEAIRGDAPFHFLQYLWNTHLDVDARKRYITYFWHNVNDIFQCSRCKNGKDIMTFLWDNVFLPTIDCEYFTEDFIRDFISECLSAHFSFSTILWFVTYMKEYRDFEMFASTVYEFAVLSHNYPAAQECYAFLDTVDKDFLAHGDASIFERILSNHDMLICEYAEVYDFLVFLVNIHGIKTLEHFWDVAFTFTRGKGYNERVVLFLKNYRATHFPLDFSDLELQYVLLQLAQCTISWDGSEFVLFLTEHYPHYLQYLYTHTLFINWVRTQTEKAKNDVYDGKDYLDFFSALKVPEHMIESLRRASVK